MTSDRLLDRDAIRSLLLEVADELSGDEGTRTLVMVGGSLLAWRGLRQSTEDVDSVRLLDAPLRAAVARVAERHDLAPDWLNSHATAFAPNTLDLDECDVLIEGGALRVLGAPLPGSLDRADAVGAVPARRPAARRTIVIDSPASTRARTSPTWCLRSRAFRVAIRCTDHA